MHDRWGQRFTLIHSCRCRFSQLVEIGFDFGYGFRSFWSRRFTIGIYNTIEPGVACLEDEVPVELPAGKLIDNNP